MNRTRQSWFCQVVLVCSLLLGAGGCDEDTTYSYFRVNVALDQTTINDDLRRRITACLLTVEGSDMAQIDLPCTRGFVPYDLGVADFSTSETAGQIRFTVRMTGLNFEELASGTSPFLPIVPNQTTTTMVVATATPMGGMPDAGTDVATGDAGSDAAADTN